MQILNDIIISLEQGDDEKLINNIQQALDKGVSAERILNEGLMVGMNKVGEKFKTREIFVPEVLLVARAMNRSMKVLEPKLVGGKKKKSAKIIIGTVESDLHDIGKNLVRMLLEGNGFEVFDLGVDVKAERFIKELREKEADIIAISALLTTTMPQIGDIIDLLKEEGLRDEVYVLIGGAPVTIEFAEEIGADGYADNAASAVDKVKELIKN